MATAASQRRGVRIACSSRSFAEPSPAVERANPLRGTGPLASGRDAEYVCRSRRTPTGQGWTMTYLRIPLLATAVIGAALASAPAGAKGHDCGQDVLRAAKSGVVGAYFPAQCYNAARRTQITNS